MHMFVSKCLVPPEIEEPELPIGIEEDLNDEDQLSDEKVLWIREWIAESSRYPSPKEKELSAC